MTFEFASWAPWILFSALGLGFYDLSIKQAVRDNPVAPVVFFATLSGTLFYLLLSALTGQFFSNAVCPPDFWLLILAKSVLVGVSWICGYYAIRELPVSIAIPIRATAPLWTFIGSVILYSEIPTPLQAVGMVSVFAGYYAFSVAGKMEGIRFRNHKGIRMVIAATLLGAASGLYDKYLLNVLQIPRGTLQFWFAIDLVFVFGFILALCRLFRKKADHPFVWRKWIPLTGILLIVSDYLYFHAVSTPDAQISILSLIRRCGCIVPFSAGLIFLGEKNPRGKTVALALSLAGVVLLVLFR